MAWSETEEEWYFSVVDIIGVLTESENPRRYWSDLKIKLKKEGSQLYADIVQLKLPSEDGKSYKTDVANAKQVFPTLAQDCDLCFNNKTAIHSQIYRGFAFPKNTIKPHSFSHKK